MTRTGYFASYSITGATLTISFGRIVSENMQIAHSCFQVCGLLIRYFFNWYTGGYGGLIKSKCVWVGCPHLLNKLCQSRHAPSSLCTIAVIYSRWRSLNHTQWPEYIETSVRDSQEDLAMFSHVCFIISRFTEVQSGKVYWQFQALGLQLLLPQTVFVTFNPNATLLG